MLVNNTANLGVLFNGFRFDTWFEIPQGSTYKITFFNGDKTARVDVNTIYLQGASYMGVMASLSAAMLAIINL